MKAKKMSIKNIKDVLTREEMKKIMAGSGSGCGSCQVTATNGTFQFGCNFDGGFSCMCYSGNDFC